MALIGILCTLVLSLVMNGIQTLRLANEQRDHATDNATHASQFAQFEKKALEDTAAARAEGDRRVNEQQEIINATITQRDNANAAAVRAAAVDGQLQKRIRELTDSLGAAANNSTAVPGRPPAATTSDLLAVVQQRLGEARTGIARFADTAHIAGNACEASYDALMVH